jgi:hypothetical protein
VVVLLTGIANETSLTGVSHRRRTPVAASPVTAADGQLVPKHINTKADGWLTRLVVKDTHDPSTPPAFNLR